MTAANQSLGEFQEEIQLYRFPSWHKNLISRGDYQLQGWITNGHANPKIVETLIAKIDFEMIYDLLPYHLVGYIHRTDDYRIERGSAGHRDDEAREEKNQYERV